MSNPLKQNSELTQPSLKKLMILKVLIIPVVFIFFVIILFEFEGKPFYGSFKPRAWTGFGKIVDEKSLTVQETGTEESTLTKKKIIKKTTTDKLQSAKTLWDWMSLLLAPATLAGLGFWFQNLQEDAKIKQAQQERDLSADQQREEALQNYLNRLSELLVDKQLKKLLPDQDKKTSDEATVNTTFSSSIDVDAALEVIKARTLSLLRLFDKDIPRKASVLSFLGDAKLLNKLDLDFSSSNFNYANLKKVNLSFVNLDRIILTNSILKFANLNHAQLYFADLSDADLSHADLSHANLKDGNLSNANLKYADLSNANLKDAILMNTDLSNAILIGVKNLTPAQIKQSQNWDKAKYDDEFRLNLHNHKNLQSRSGEAKP